MAVKLPRRRSKPSRFPGVVKEWRNQKQRQSEETGSPSRLSDLRDEMYQSNSGTFLLHPSSDPQLGAP